MGMRFYKCDRCGQIINKVNSTSVPVICCGEEMKELVPGTDDKVSEKHVPEFTVKGNVVDVTVGAVPHPMEEGHHIQWIALKTKCGCQLKPLKPGMEPHVQFAIADGDEVENVYEYCNIHSLWCR